MPRVRFHRILTGWLLVGVAGMLGTLTPVVGLGKDEAAITRVEEDWRIEIVSQNFGGTAPEIKTVISPRADLKHECGVLEMNHGTQPTFTAGGLQLQCLYDDTPVGAYRHLESVSLSSPGETISFTMAMTLRDRWIKFEIEKGSSQTWGTFGKGVAGNLKGWWRTDLKNLNQYSPQNSVDNSRVDRAKHQVKNVVLKSVRYYAGDKLVKTDDTPRTVWDRSTLDTSTPVR